MPSSFAVIIPWHRHRDTWNILQVSAIQFGVESLQLNPPPELWSNAFGGGRCSWSTCNDVFLHRFSLALHCGLPALVLHNVVAVLPLGFGFVLNRLGGASCNAGHTVGTIPFPNWFSACYANVAKGASLSAFPAGDTAVRHSKPLIRHRKLIEQGVDWPA